MSLTSVAVFCGSRHGHDPVWTAAARATGELLASHGITVVYGGGRVGLMGELADAALGAGGKVIGVIPHALNSVEVAYEAVSELYVVETMHERKALMAELSDAFWTLPGGAGTLEEIAEQWTWNQLGLHAKRCGFLDVEGYWAPLRQMIDQMVEAGFLAPEQAEIVTFRSDPVALLEVLQTTA